MVPIEEADEEDARQKKLAEEKEKSRLFTTLTGFIKGASIHADDISNLLDFELDGRLILKDRALKTQDLALYHQIDKLKPDAIEFLVRQQDDVENSKFLKIDHLS